ncbi:hypothetical protein L3Q82_007790 [Scortum barcoo]|uniref:Uncharacterized protein n=1 Tax=Scortum barcoo TaxID=214431 RepID=A0ACB8WNE3_9TELE|nr:hypothetical protein L3Q82_007790 [Scortum barcoo]
MPRDRLALLRPTSSPALKAAFRSLQQPVDLPCQPWLLIGPNSDGLEYCYIISALGDVGSDDICVLLEVCDVKMAACSSAAASRAPGVKPPISTFLVGLEANFTGFACVNKRVRYSRTELIKIRDGSATSTTNTTNSGPRTQGPAGQTAAPEDTGLAQRCPPDRGQEEAVCAEAEEGQTRADC